MRRARALARFARDPELILAGLRGRGFVFDRRGDLAARRLAGLAGFTGRRCAGNAVAIGAPIGGLHPHDLRGLVLGHARRLIGRRHVQDLTAAQPVHVLVVERALVTAEQCDEHLLEAHVLGLVNLGNLRQRVAAPHRVGIALARVRA